MTSTLTLALALTLTLGPTSGTWHFRTTFLPPEDKIDSVISQLQAYHAKFMAQYK